MAKTKKKKIDIDHITELVRDIKGLEQTKKQLDDQIEAAKAEIKAVMTVHKLDELIADVFTIRYKPVTTARFDQKEFKANNKDLYEMYLKSSETMKFTIT